MEDYSLLHMIEQAHESGVVSLEVENGHILSGSSDGTAKLWHLESATLVGAVGKKAKAVWMAGFGKGQHKNIVVALKEDDAFLDVSGIARSKSFFLTTTNISEGAAVFTLVPQLMMLSAFDVLLSSFVCRKIIAGYHKS
jgi:hypothetical protein